MLDIGWSEMAVIALVALVVIGPKDLPKAMKAAAFWVRKARSLASEFHSGIDQLVRVNGQWLIKNRDVAPQ